MDLSALIRRFLLAVAVLCVAATPSFAAGDAPPAHLAQTLGATRPATVVQYTYLLETARDGDLNAAVVDTTHGWVVAADETGRVVAAPIPAPTPGADPVSEQQARAASATPDVFTLSQWLTARQVTVVPLAGTAIVGGGIPAFVVPLGFLLIFVTVAAIMMLQRRGGGGRRSGAAGHGKMRKNALVAPPSTRFADVAGCDEAVDELHEVVAFLADPERFARVGARMPRGVILHGPPGTGKTLLAKAVAGEAGTAFFAVSGSDFVDTFVGVGAARVRDLFAEARKQDKGAIIFFDEIDAIGRQRGGGGGSGSDSEREATLNQLLVELDGFGDRDRIVVMAATNRVDMLDQALTRPGRFDRRVQVGLPAEAGRKAILEIYAANKPIEDVAALARVATVTAGFSGADLANLLNEAAIMAARDGREQITAADMDEGMLRAIAGPKKRDRSLAEGELEQIAWHEAGHCLAAELCPTHTKTQRVTIAARGNAGGLALYGAEDRALTSPQRLHERMIVAMAGRAAEQIVFGHISSGAANDLEQANTMARQAVEKLGFSTRVGQLIRTDPLRDGPMSETNRAAVEAEVTAMVDLAYRDAIALLQEHREVLDALATSLLENEQIERDQINEIVGGRAARPPRPRPEPVPEPATVEVTVTAAPPPPAEGRRRLAARIPYRGAGRGALTAARVVGRAGGAMARPLARRLPRGVGSHSAPRYSASRTEQDRPGS